MATMEELKLKLTASERDELGVLERAVERTLERYKSTDTAANLKDWEAAKDALGRTVARLLERYFPTEPVHKDRKAALIWLRDQGYKVSQGKFYQDCAKGLCAVGQDGTIRESAIFAYAAQHLRKLEVEAGGLLEPKQAEKLEEEIAHLRAKRQLTEFNLEKDQGKYLPRKDFGLELAARAGVLEQGLKNLFRTRIMDLIHMVGGDPAKAQTAMDWLLIELDGMLAEYASMERFHVIFDTEEMIDAG